MEETIFVIVYDVRIGGYKVSADDPVLGAERQYDAWEDNYYCDSIETGTELEKILRKEIMEANFKPYPSDPSKYWFDYKKEKEKADKGNEEVSFELILKRENIYYECDEISLSTSKREIRKTQIVEKNGSYFYKGKKIIQKEDLEKNEELYQNAKKEYDEFNNKFNNNLAELKKDSFYLYTRLLSEVLGKDVFMNDTLQQKE